MILASIKQTLYLPADMENVPSAFITDMKDIPFGPIKAIHPKRRCRFGFWADFFARMDFAVSLPSGPSVHSLTFSIELDFDNQVSL
jgi:hypothetical protein